MPEWSKTQYPQPEARNPSLREWERITLAHGGGGQLTDQLIADVILPRLGNESLSDLLDSGELGPVNGRLVMTTDGYVVQPLFFPGGDIGRLAVSGTVNDLAVVGAKPLAISLSMILAEGLERCVLERVLDSVASTALEAGVRVVTGDTKVVGRGQADGMYLVTSGVGLVENPRKLPAVRLHPQQVQIGDQIILNGRIADHGLAVMLARELPEVQSAVQSDVAPLAGLIADLIQVLPGIRFMRDPTRGGVASVAADLAARTGHTIRLYEDAIPVSPATRHAAEMLGLDPLEVANEGKVFIVVNPSSAQQALEVLRQHPLGREACVVGEVLAGDGRCELQTKIGGRRIVPKPYGEQLPRIC